MNRPAFLLALALGLATATATAAADGAADYDPQSWEWNGMAQFVTLAEGMGFEVSAVSDLDWGTLGRSDILFVVYPQQRLDPKRLGDFIQAGGNAVIADDFGNADEAMTQLGVLRSRAGAPRAVRYYDARLWAPIATVTGSHPLIRGVQEVVTNHPGSLERLSNATAVLRFADRALVAAGERGAGKFVVVADPSIFINRMQQDPFRGNMVLTGNLLRWLSRNGATRRVVLLRGDATMFGEPQPFIDDPSGGWLGRVVAEVNAWMYNRHDWLLTALATKLLAIGLAIGLLALAIAAMPVRAGRKIHGLWLRFRRPVRRDDPHLLMRQVDQSHAAPQSLLVVACLLRDDIQRVLAALDQPPHAPPRATPDPLYTLSEADLMARVSAARGPEAAAALAKVYPRLRALPSRGHAAAPWSSARLSRRDFETLDADVRQLYRTLGGEQFAGR